MAEARSNADVFADLGNRLGLWDDDEPRTELDTLLTILSELPPEFGSPLRDTGVATPPWEGAPVQ